MRYVCAQPATIFYTWQVEVMINNFKRQGVNPNHIDILCGIENGVVPHEWSVLRNHYNTIRFFFYDDTRTDRSYIPSIYFHLLKQHIAANPELRDEQLFLHDSDILFTRTPQLDWVHSSSKIWYMSDTCNYINHDYIQQKGNDIYEDMCAIVGLDPLIPKLMNSNSGGAQYIVTGEGYSFWDKVEKDSNKLYSYFCKRVDYDTEKMGELYPIQKWTAGMWSLLWNAWKSGHETKVDPRMDFGWSTNPISDIDKHWILHNAGVSAEDTRLFYKGAYLDKLPYGESLDIDTERASYYYWKEIQETAKCTVLV